MAEPLGVQWPEGTDVMVMPGIPGKMQRLETGEDVYPTITSDVVKLLAEQGFAVRYATPVERRARVGFKAAEYWFPILVLAQEALASGVGDILASIIRDRIGRASLRRAKLHVKMGQLQQDGASVEWFEAHGPADEVLAAIEKVLGSGQD